MSAQKHHGCNQHLHPLETYSRGVHAPMHVPLLGTRELVCGWRVFPLSDNTNLPMIVLFWGGLILPTECTRGLAPVSRVFQDHPVRFHGHLRGRIAGLCYFCFKNQTLVPLKWDPKGGSYNAGCFNYGLNRRALFDTCNMMKVKPGGLGKQGPLQEAEFPNPATSVVPRHAPTHLGLGGVVLEGLILDKSPTG